MTTFSAIQFNFSKEKCLTFIIMNYLIYLSLKIFHPSLDDTTVIVKQSHGENQQPLIILRRGYSQNFSALHQSGLSPNWWGEQIFSRNFQLPQSQHFELIHQRMHNRHHFLFFNRAQSFLNTLDDFLPPIRPKIEVSWLIISFFLRFSRLINKKLNH